MALHKSSILQSILLAISLSSSLSPPHSALGFASALSHQPNFPHSHPRQFSPRDYVTPAQRYESYDYVVAGGGLAGLIVASRLSDDSSKTVLVLEAGPSGDSLRDRIDVPGEAYYASMLSQPGFSWGYNTVPQPHANNREMTQPRGRTLGGSAAINGMYIVRPPRTQADTWRNLIASSSSDTDADEWGWDSMFQALKDLETFTPPTDEARATAGMRYNEGSLGTNGPLHVTYPGYMVPVTGSWFPALEAAGVSINPDAFSGDNIGGFFALSSINPSNWTRSYSKTGWIDTLPPRTNLHIISEATVERILFSDSGENKQATGVRFSNGKGTEAFEVKVNKEVVLAGGAMGSPHMLLVSGVGPRDVLEAAGVDVQVELPGVGQHLQDHLAAGVYFQARTDTQGSIRNSGSDLSRTPEFNSFVNNGIAYINGSLLFGSSENHATFRASLSPTSNPSTLPPLSTLVPSSNPQVLAGYNAILQATIDSLYPSDGLIEVLLSINSPDEIAVQAALQLPLSHCRIYISSPSIYDPLLIDPNYFSHPADIVMLRQGVKLARQIASAEGPLGYAVGEEVSPGAGVGSDEEIEAWLRANVGTEFHPTGTAAMMKREEGGVVDAKLKVYGTSNVRVVDASVFPISFSAHMMTPTYALAEKAAAIIQEAANPGSSSPSGGNSGSGSGSGNGNGSGSGSGGTSSATGVVPPGLWKAVTTGALVVMALGGSAYLV